MKKLEKLSEGELILLVQKADEQAFQELYERYKNLVYFVAFKMCQNDADAQDVLQESFLEIRRSISRLQKPDYFRLWMYRIVNSKCKKLFRNNKFKQTELEHDDTQFKFVEERKEFIPSSNMRFQTDSNILHTFIDELPENQRMAVILFYMEQMTSAEIAKICDVSEGTIKSRLFTARNSLKEKISSYEKREGTKLNLHDLGASLALSCTANVAHNANSASASTVKKYSSNFKKFLQVNTITVKTTAIFCVSALAITGGYVAYRQSQMSDTPTQTLQEPLKQAFPMVTFKEEAIHTSKDAYYTLKMNFCKQDLGNLDENEMKEVQKLYQALKDENGVYYKRLQISGWERGLEK